MHPQCPAKQRGPGRSSSFGQGSGLCPHSPAIVAGRAGRIDRVVTPLAGDRIRTRENVTADDDASADAGTENDAEDDLRAGTGPVGRLRQRETVGIVGDRHFAPEQRLEIGLDRLGVETY